MELVTGYILEAEVRDKRHVGLASTNMEKQALQNALQRLRSSIDIVEVVSDASPAIKKLLGRLTIYGVPGKTGTVLFLFILGFHVTSQDFPNMDVRHICAPRKTPIPSENFRSWCQPGEYPL